MVQLHNRCFSLIYTSVIRVVCNERSNISGNSQNPTFPSTACPHAKTATTMHYTMKNGFRDHSCSNSTLVRRKQRNSTLRPKVLEACNIQRSTVSIIHHLPLLVH